ncbi:MAG: thiol reductant ABC exporter subunit CydD [bacterium]
MTNTDIKAFLKAQKKLSGRYIQLAVALGLTAGLLLIVQAWLLSNIVSAVVFDHLGLADTSHWLWGLFALFLVRAVLTWASEQTAFRAAMNVKRQLRQQLHSHLQALGPAFLNNERSGEITNALVDGVEALQDYYARYLPTMSLVALVPLAILVFIVPLDWLSGVILIVTAPLIPFFMIIIGQGTENLNKKQWRKMARLSAHLLDMIQGLTTLRLFNASRREAVIIEQVADDYRRSTMSVLRIAFLSSLALEFLATVSIALVAVTIGFRLFYGEMDFFYGFFVLLLAPEFYLPLRNMGTHYHARLEAIGAAERILQILQTPAPIQVGEKPVSIPELRHTSICLDRISHTYPGGRQALEEVSFCIPAGQRIALVGTSGAGKSTLMQLILGFLQPTSGSIRVGEIDLSQIPAQQWQQQLSWVPQNPHLFHATVAENIALGQPQASMEAIEKAAEKANALEFIQQLPQGFNTLVGEKGMGLSGGQIQRIALARAFLKDAPLVLLDEATANLDQQSESLIQRSIESLAKRHTLLVIAHRLRTVEHADLILVLDQGKIVESGDHVTLVKNSGRYASMLKTLSGQRGA